MENFERHIAEEFVLNTSKNVFLTGRAGTGKTTFLKTIIKKTQKNTIVVAPTGVAAINAKGITIHSMFQLPLTAFIPSNDHADLNICTNRPGLLKHMKYRSDKRKLIESMELLIIDEISMVRADLLDAIDYILRVTRKNNQAFGGVQLLVIGDLFQLSPVVKDHIWPLLKPYYKSPFFFDAHSWILSNPIKIELQTIYRQKDKNFIDILNNVRLGTRVDTDITRLNQNYDPTMDDDGIITLTTHNYKADDINSTQMENLTSKRYSFDAVITGKFRESSYPTSETIGLKEGAQVMFIRNHSEGLYYNGKIGVIDQITQSEIKVYFKEEDSFIKVERDEWNNTKYTLNKKTKNIDQEIVGTFAQYPLKLAWAITVHKSQGLTFDKVSVDLSHCFAPGQMYVALSRCRSLDGLRLRSKVIPNNIIIDNRIANYYDSAEIDESINQKLIEAKEIYSFEQLLQVFNFASLTNQLEEWEQLIKDGKVIELGKALVVQKQISTVINKTLRLGRGFQKQLKEIKQDENDDKLIIKRTKKAIDYFTHEIYQDAVLILEDHIKKFKIKKNTRIYIRFLEEIRNDIWFKLDQLFYTTYKEKRIHPKEPIFIKTKYFDTNDINEPKKPQKGETQKLTLELFNTGRSLEEIAEARSLKMSTIQSHMTKWLENDAVKITQLMPQDQIDTLTDYFIKANEESLAELVKNAPFSVGFHEMRWIRLHANKPKDQKKLF